MTRLMAAKGMANSTLYIITLVKINGVNSISVRIKGTPYEKLSSCKLMLKIR